MTENVDKLFERRMTPEQIAAGEALAGKYMGEMLLAEMRKFHGVSQRDLAKLLKIKQPSLSKLESQDDMYLSTLKRIVEALGGKLIVKVEFPNALVDLKQSTRPSTRSRRPHRQTSKRRAA